MRVRRARLSALTRVALVSAALVGPAAAAAAPSAPVVTLRDPSELPFSADDLAHALAARLGPEANGGSIEVAPSGPGGVAVRVRGRARLVAVGTRTAASAARVVALAIADLAADDVVPAMPTVARAAPTNELASPPASPAAAPPARRVTATTGAAKGLGAEELLAARLDFDIAFPLGGHGARVAPSCGLVFMPTRGAGTYEDVSFVSGTARLLAGVGTGIVDASAGPFVSRYSIGGETTHNGTLVGIEALGRVAAPLVGRARLVVALAFDTYVNRVRALWLDGRAYATPRIGLALGVGISWDLGS